MIARAGRAESLNDNVGMTISHLPVGIVMVELREEEVSGYGA